MYVMLMVVHPPGIGGQLKRIGGLLVVVVVVVVAVRACVRACGIADGAHASPAPLQVQRSEGVGRDGRGVARARRLRVGLGHQLRLSVHH